MDARRGSRIVNPKVRQVGFFTLDAPNSPDRSLSGPPNCVPSQQSLSPPTNSLSPVMIPPPRHLSDNLASRSAVLPVPAPANWRNSADQIPVGSYNPSETLLATSPMASPSSRIEDEELEMSEDSSTSVWYRRSGSGKIASSFPGVGIHMAAKSSENSQALPLKALEPNKPAGVSEKNGGASTEVQNRQPPSNSKPLKAKTTKAERRALQEAQRAAKGEANKSGNAPGKAVKQSLAMKDNNATPSVAPTDKRGGDRTLDKERKKDAPPPRMQFDDKNRVEKAKKRAVFNQTEARNRVELFRHLPQYEQGTQLPDLVSKFFQLDPIHPAIYKVGLQYMAGDICGGNARCIAMLHAFQQAIKDYSTPPQKVLGRDLTAKIGGYVSFFNECRPLSVSMGNAIRFLKNRIAKLPLNLPESEVKATLCSDIDRFINEKIIIAAEVIVRHAATKIRDGDVLLTYGSSSVVEMLLLHAHELGKEFRIVVVDSRPKQEGRALLRRLIERGLNCTYTHINAISYVMHEVTRVFLGAAAVLSNGTVYSRVGTAAVAMVANAFRVPVLICCEAYKFHERVQLDSICFNELGDPDAISKVPERKDINYLDNMTAKEQLQLLNLMYDATPSDYISMIVTDYGMIPPTSVPVIVREYRREHLWI
ncbi:probable translation initiation factor eIF-2B subunit delta [Cucurbita pepo subsp. pepo]|uniref:probable translation initiation factor eIF-2B subunit delta n=1 Tax=Cucurbita pepo subsp. pepo TaxID=3664 RepID=UPI000C9DA220|nr:probable translation initiation factor eIF-2B subunit delta [Cucurbita pepo subsp. pepo]